MHLKKLAVIGAVALVVLGCVVAAGCTSQQQTGTDDKFIGAWSSPYDYDGVTGTAIDVMKKDGTGFFVLLNKEGNRLLKYYGYTWKNNGNNSCSLTVPSTSKSATFTCDSTGNMLTGSEGITLQRMDSITGIWFTSATDSTGKILKSTHVLLPDGTGTMYDQRENGAVKVAQVKWVKNTDGTYTITASDGDSGKWTLDPTKEKITSDSGIVFIKKFTDSYYYLSILGPWYNAVTKGIAFFNGDGTGIFTTDGETKEGFSWTIPEFGKFKITMLEGDNKGKDYLWTYDREKDTFTNSTNTALVRPTTDLSGLTTSKFSATVSTGKCPVVGQWICNNFTSEGKTFTAVQTIKADGTGYWMHLADTPGIQILEVTKSSFDKYDWDGTFDKKASNGNTYVMVYDPAKKTLTEEGTNVYTKLDSLVGIWSGKINKSDKTSHLFKADGTGFASVSSDDGTADVVKLTWKKNSDGTYTIEYSGGDKVTYTLDQTGKTITSTTGKTKTKEFMDSYFLMSMVGPWYSKESNASAVFNADGTGFVNSKYGVSSFTWKVNDIGKFGIAITYSGDTSSKDMVSEWTYDRENDVFTSSYGVKYIRPTENVSGKITFY